jgi:hypothetical protein
MTGKYKWAVIMPSPGRPGSSASHIQFAITRPPAHTHTHQRMHPNPSTHTLTHTHTHTHTHILESGEGCPWEYLSKKQWPLGQRTPGFGKETHGDPEAKDVQRHWTKFKMCFARKMEPRAPYCVFAPMCRSSALSC